MEVVAAYLLAVLGGNVDPCADDINVILESVGAEAEEERMDLLLTQVRGDITELIAAGREKFASVPSGGGVATVAVAAGGGGGAAAVPAAAETKEEKVEQEESDDVWTVAFLFFKKNLFKQIFFLFNFVMEDMCFSLFD